MRIRHKILYPDAPFGCGGCKKLLRVHDDSAGKLSVCPTWAAAPGNDTLKYVCSEFQYP